MNESQFGDKLRQLLDQGLSVMPSTADRLKNARELALARQRRHQDPVLACADNVLGHSSARAGIARRLLLPIATALIAVAAIYSWHHHQRNAALEEIDAQLDAQLLTDSLPIDAYLDTGFQHWLTERGWRGGMDPAKRNSR